MTTIFHFPSMIVYGKVEKSREMRRRENREERREKERDKRGRPLRNFTKTCFTPKTNIVTNAQTRNIEHDLVELAYNKPV